MTAHFTLVPRDGLFCKDGRGWHTSVTGRGHGLDWPWPQTVLGALRSAWGREEETRIGRRFGPTDWRERTAAISLGRTLALRRGLGASWAATHRVWPAPSDSLRLERHDALHRLDPTPPRLRTLGRDDDDVREMLWVAEQVDRAKPLPAPRWWCEARFSAWLAGGSVPAHDLDNTFEPSRRVQAHVAIRWDTLSAEDGALYSHDVVETIDAGARRTGAEWAIGVEAALPGEGLPAIGTLGSDSRLVRIEHLSEAVFEPPTELLRAFRVGARGLRLVVVTPACFTGGWLPDGIERHGRELRGLIGAIDSELVLRAAMVPRPVHVSGWDVAARAPKATSRMVAPGAVYFFERADGTQFREEDARSLWLSAVGARTGEGFGRVVPGVWNPRRSEG